MIHLAEMFIWCVNEYIWFLRPISQRKCIKLSVLHPTDSETVYMQRYKHAKYATASKCICLDAQNYFKIIVVILFFHFSIHSLTSSFKCETNDQNRSTNTYLIFISEACLICCFLFFVFLHLACVHLPVLVFNQTNTNV